MTTPLPRPSAVIDTNVVLDWLVFRDPSCEALAAAVEGGALHWLLTPAMKEECERVLGRPVFVASRGHALKTLARWAHMIDTACRLPRPLELRCSDPSDQKFIDLALDTDARWLITRDKALMALARRAALRGIEVLPPARWSFAPGSTTGSATRRGTPLAAEA